MLLLPMDGALVDVVNGRVWTRGGNASASKGTPQGVAATFDGVDDFFSFTGYPEIVGNTGTFFLWMPRVGVYDANGHVYLGSNTTSSSWFQLDVSHRPYVFGSLINVVGPDIRSSSNRSLVFSSDGTAASKAYFVDGTLQASGGAGAPVAFAAGNKTFRFGAWAGGGLWDCDMDCVVAGFTTRTWSDVQARAFHENPWQLFEPEPARVYFSEAAGGGGPAEGSGEGDIIVGAVGAGAASEGAGTGTVALGGVGAGSEAAGAGTGDVELAGTGAGAAAEGAGAADVVVGGAGTGQASEGAGEADITLGGAGAGADTAGQGAGVGDVSLGGVGVGAAAEGAGTGDVTLDGNGAGEAIVAPEGSGVGNLVLGGAGGGAAAEGAGEADIALGAEGAGEAAPSTFGTVRVFDLAAHRCAVSTSSNKCAVVTAAAFRCDIQTAIAA